MDVLQAKEFDLCRKVSDVTGWKDTDFYLCYEWDVNGHRTGEKVIEHRSFIEIEGAEDKVIHPVYSSDDIITKLDRWIKIDYLKNNDNTSGVEVFIPSKKDRNFGKFSTGETLQIALLNLVLFLHKEGEEL